MAGDFAAKGYTFSVGKPRVRTEVRVRSVSARTNYDIAPDGKRLAGMVMEEEAGKLPTSLTILLHFGDEPRRTAAGGN